MSGKPYIAFYPSDWLAGTRGMSAAETGVYITLIAMMYEREEPLSMDHKRLARLCGTTPATFAKIVGALIDDGKISDTDQGLWNFRVEKECKIRQEKSMRASEAASQKWKKAQQNQGNAYADASIPQCDRNANHNHNHNHKTNTPPKGSPPSEIHEAVTAYNDLAEEVGLPKAQRITPKRKSAIKARLGECGGVEGWRYALDRIRGSPFCRGENARGWRADLDFLCQQSSFTKLMEGAYDGKQTGKLEPLQF